MKPACPEPLDLREALFEFDNEAKSLDSERVQRAAQYIVDEAREHIHKHLQGCLNTEQVRYFQQVVAIMRRSAGKIINVPSYEALADLGQNCRVTLKGDMNTPSMA